MIDIESLPWAYKDKATWAQLGSATLDLMDKCVFGKRAGGISTGLGKSSKSRSGPFFKQVDVVANSPSSTY